MGSLKIQFDAKHQKKTVGPFGDKKIERKVAQCRKKIE